MHLTVDEKRILWPGSQLKKPEGFMIPTHLKVLTIEEKPFVYARKLSDSHEMCGTDEIACPHFNSTEDGKYRPNHGCTRYNSMRCNVSRLTTKSNAEIELHCL